MGDVVFKHRWNVFLGEVALRIGDQEAGFAAATVADYDKFFGVGRG